MLFTVRQYKKDGLYNGFADALLFEEEFRNYPDALDCILERCPTAKIHIEGAEPLGNNYYSIQCRYDYALDKNETFFYKTNN